MKEPIKDKIIGTWKLVSWKYVNEQGGAIDFFGENPMGILMYDKAGYMNVQLMRSGRKNFNSESLTGGAWEEIKEAYLGYVGYYGRYWERTPGELVHEVEGSLFPNWVGREQVRYGKIEGEYLLLSTPPIDAQEKKIVFNVTWKRA